MSEEYSESCWECGFNQKDSDERDIEQLEEILKDLEIIEEIDWEKYFKKFFDIQEKWQKRYDKLKKEIEYYKNK